MVCKLIQTAHHLTDSPVPCAIGHAMLSGSFFHPLRNHRDSSHSINILSVRNQTHECCVVSIILNSLLGKFYLLVCHRICHRVGICQMDVNKCIRQCNTIVHITVNLHTLAHERDYLVRAITIAMVVCTISIVVDVPLVADTHIKDGSIFLCGIWLCVC